MVGRIEHGRAGESGPNKDMVGKVGIRNSIERLENILGEEMVGPVNVSQEGNLSFGH